MMLEGSCKGSSERRPPSEPRADPFAEYIATGGAMHLLLHTVARNDIDLVIGCRHSLKNPSFRITLVSGARQVWTFLTPCSPSACRQALSFLASIVYFRPSSVPQSLHLATPENDPTIEAYRPTFAYLTQTFTFLHFLFIPPQPPPPASCETCNATPLSPHTCDAGTKQSRIRSSAMTSGPPQMSKASTDLVGWN